MDITWLDPFDTEHTFPDVETALLNPEGLLAAGGDLSLARLLKAYRTGIFPWYEYGQPILWWSPDPRGVLFLHKFHISTSLRRALRKHKWNVTFDGNFKQTIQACAAPRSYARGTWITSEMAEAYANLHQHGYAHSVELWDENEKLVGGIYGVQIGKMFFGESMFSFQSNASKIALTYLVAHLQSWGFTLLDCQLPSPHLCSLGAEALTRKEYIEIMSPLCEETINNFSWQLDKSLEVKNWRP